MLSGSVCADTFTQPDPEIPTGKQAKSSVSAENFMIVTAHPEATRAGYKILKRGGSAADAAIAAQLVLGLVEPQSSGLGGGAFALYYDAHKKELSSFDARESAPFLGGPFLFYKNGKPLAFEEARLGGKSVGVPGVPMLLSDLHELHGKLTWMELFEEAINLADKGFEVSPRLARMIEANREELALFPETAAYFLDENKEPLKEGAILKNPAYAETLRDFAFYGASRFYKGTAEQAIVQKVQNASPNPGLLSDRDFKEYSVKRRDPVCGPYRVYIVCSMGEPSSGGLTLLQILGMLERFDLEEWGADDPRSWHVMLEASRLAFADRNIYMADPDFVNTPGVALIAPEYTKDRGTLIDPGKAFETARAGKPPLWQGPIYEGGVDPDFPGTSHISVIDAQGNIVSMTTSIESAFGSHLMVDGFLLNNQLTDFSLSPFDEEKKLVANMVEPGKRPRSSMAPTIVFDRDGRPVLVIGSAGGSSIIGYVLQRIVAVLDWGMDVQEALDMPNILSRGEKVEMEEADQVLQQELQALGHEVVVRDKNSGLTAIRIQDHRYFSAADPRREGVGMGE